MKERSDASKSYKLTKSIIVLYYNLNSLYIEVNAVTPDALGKYHPGRRSCDEVDEENVSAVIMIRRGLTWNVNRTPNTMHMPKTIPVG